MENITETYVFKITILNSHLVSAVDNNLTPLILRNLCLVSLAYFVKRNEEFINTGGHNKTDVKLENNLYNN